MDCRVFNPQRSLLVSILSLGRPANVLRQLESLPRWLADVGTQLGIVSHIIVRNNDPNVMFDAVAARMTEIEAAHPDMTCTLVTDVPNNGFGKGHNENIGAVPSDFVLILNDDIGFPHMDWLGDALCILQNDNRIACVAAEENPKHVNPMFGNGLLPGAFHIQTISYAEASILLFDRQVFDRVGGFNSDFAWAMCEDADLSLRVQQFGYRLVHLAMPHEHWRSTSFNSLPGPVKSSILEHNRAALFANWRDTLTTGTVGRYDVFDLWSDGLGDVFCALPHLLARLAPLSPEHRANVIVNTSSVALVELLGLDGIAVTSVKNLGQLRAEWHKGGIASLRSTRDANFSLPFNIHPLLAGTLGIGHARRTDLLSFSNILRRLRLPAHSESLTSGQYCVIHLEFERDHEGRALSPAACARLLELCGRLFDTVVLVGRAVSFPTKLFGAATARIIDLQGTLSIAQLTAVVANSKYFVGIDSFPSHIAQASGVPSAVFFGAVHPLTRAWDATRLWPLMAPIDCIGCYHTHLELSLPFCMRRDQACTTEITVADQRRVLESMIRGEPFNWSADCVRLHELQAKLLKVASHHPAPPERLFRSQLMGNEQISNLIYRVTEQMGDLLRGQYQTSAVNALTARTQELQADLYTSKIELDEVRRQLRQRRTAVLGKPGLAAYPSRILQLSTLRLEPSRCRTSTAHPWIEVEAFEDDPQLLLPPIQGLGAKIQLRLSCITEVNDGVEVYWAVGKDEFSADRKQTFMPNSSSEICSTIFDLAMGEILRIRIDPTRGSGNSRLLGAIGGVFALLEGNAGMDETLDGVTSGAVRPELALDAGAQEVISTPLQLTTEIDGPLPADSTRARSVRRHRRNT